MRSFEEQVTEALERARNTQDEYWDALTELEKVLGGEVDSGRNWYDTTAEQLIEEFAPEVEADA